MNPRELLLEAERRYPPPPGQHHSLILTDDGQLSLWLTMPNQQWESFLIDDADQGKDPRALLDTVAELRHQAVPSHAPIPVELAPVYTPAALPLGGPDTGTHWKPPVEEPLERVRRTDDGTYPNAGEELAKLARRAAATNNPDELKKLGQELADLPTRDTIPGPEPEPPWRRR